MWREMDAAAVQSEADRKDRVCVSVREREWEQERGGGRKIKERRWEGKEGRERLPDGFEVLWYLAYLVFHDIRMYYYNKLL